MAGPWGAIAEFSPSDAALEGFRVLREHWRVAVGWALFNIVALIALGVATAVLAFGATAASSAGALAFNPLVGQLLASLGETFVAVIIAAGLFRLMLRPAEPGYLHLRIGPDEVRMFVIWIATSMALFLLAGVLALLVTTGRALGPAATFIAWIIAAAVGVWIALRFSLATVATFEERRFAVMASWRLTRGHAWSLLGMAVLSLTVTALIAVIVALLIFVVMSFSVGFGAAVEGLFTSGGAQSHPGVYLAEAAAELVLFPAFAVLLLAPWVAAYQAFRQDAGREP